MHRSSDVYDELCNHPSTFGPDAFFLPAADPEAAPADLLLPPTGLPFVADAVSETGT